jgi:hypothetical protein
MFTSLKTLLRRVDFYLRDEAYRPPTGEITLRPIDDLFEKNPDLDPLRTRVYWGIRRFWNNHWICNPRDVYYKFVYAYQRVVRGWDDRAVWSIDWWLDDKMPDMLRQLKRDKHGIPGSMFEGLPTIPDEEWNYTDEAYVIAEQRWDAIMDKMIAAFEASRRIQNHTYPELGDYPLYRPEGVSKEDWKKAKDDHFAASKLLAERDQQIFDEGMALFVKHYWSLWD